MAPVSSGGPTRNPFRSEQDAFRIVVYVVVAGLIVFLAATLVATWLGVVLAIVAVAAALVKIVAWLSELLGDPAPSQRQEDEGNSTSSPS